MIMWMLWSTVFAAFVGGAAIALERAAALLGLPRRYVWMAALVVGAVLPGFLALYRPRPIVEHPLQGVEAASPSPSSQSSRLIRVGGSISSDPPAPRSHVARSRTVEADASALLRQDLARVENEAASLDTWVARLWILSSLVLLIYFARTMGALARRSTGWREAEVGPCRALISPREGPAVIAMLAALGFSAARFQSGLAAPEQSLALVATSAASVGGDERGAGVAAPIRRANESSVAVFRAARALFARVNAARMLVVSGSAATKLDEPLLIGWAALSTAGVLIIAFAAFRLARPRPRWSTTMLDGVPVLVSRDLGPAAIGVFRYRIVLPGWALELPRAERDLVMAHEREHAKAGDPSLLFVATVLVALSPWNAPLWWMARRLRFAIELDCDARVLRDRSDRTAYGALLLAVSERTYGGAMPVLALAEPVSLVERRIAAIAGRLPRFARLRAAIAGSGAAMLIATAWVAPRPETAPSMSGSVATRPAALAPEALAAPLDRSDTGASDSVYTSAQVDHPSLLTDTAQAGARRAVVTATDTVWIRGRVTGPDGAPIADALVTASGLVSFATDSVRTNADGRYNFADGKGDGDYMMLFTATGFVPYGPMELRRDVSENILVMNVKLGFTPGSPRLRRATGASFPPSPQSLFIAPMPVAAAARGMTVTAEFFVNAQGLVDTLRFNPTPDSAYNVQLDSVLRRIRFSPGSAADGTPVAAWASISYTFPP